MKSPDRPAAALAVRGLTKIFGKDVQALRGVDLDVQEGEFVTLLGPSGSGKTTLLMIVGGFEEASSGSVIAHGVDITRVPPERRNMAVVFQSYALFPHMSVRGNVSYPLAARGIRGKARDQMVDEALEMVDLIHLGGRRPSQLSGGQQQRVAVARALVYGPSVLLLDEPLGALDRALRERMQVELRRLHRKVGVTFLYVTHDQEEALTMSDRVAVMLNGRIEQTGTPEQLYNQPQTAFVAGFLGSANRIPATAVAVTDRVAQVEFGPNGAKYAVPCAADRFQIGAGIILLIHSEKVGIGPVQAPIDKGMMTVDGRLEREAFAGRSWRYEVSTGHGTLFAETSNRVQLVVGEAIRLFWHPREAWAIPKASEIPTEADTQSGG